MIKITLYLTIPKICKIIKERIDNDFDCLIVIDGKRGKGKSTIAIKMARFLKGKNFNFLKDIVYTKNEVNKALSTRYNDVIIADEMINVGFKRDFYNEDQKNLIKMIAMYRDNRNIMICCLPSFHSLDKGLKEMVALRIAIKERGMGIIHVPIDNEYNPDQWDVDNNKKLYMKMISKNKSKINYSDFSTFYGYLRFADLTENQKIKYKAVKEFKRNKIAVEITKEVKPIEEKRDEFEVLLDRILGGLESVQSLKLYAINNKTSYQSLVNKLKIRLEKRGIAKKLKFFLDDEKNALKKKTMGVFQFNEKNGFQ